MAAPGRIDLGSPVCPHCLRRQGLTPSSALRAREEVAGGVEAVPCTRCRDAELAFCSARCAEDRGPLHAMECALVEPLLGLLFEVPLPLQRALLLLRCSLAATLRKDGGEPTAGYAFLGCLEDHIEDGPALDDSAAAELAQLLSSAVAAASPEDVQRWLSRIDTYAFCCGCGGTAGGALFRLASFFNHSCCPNALTRWDATAGEMVVTAAEPIAAGEEITISYLGHRCELDSCACGLRWASERAGPPGCPGPGPGPGTLALPLHWPSMGRAERRQRLLATKHFACCCPRCERESGDEPESAASLTSW